MGKIATEKEASQIGFAGTSEGIVLPEPNKCVTRGRLSALNCQISILHTSEYNSDNQLVQLEHIQKKGGITPMPTINRATVINSFGTWYIKFTNNVASRLQILISAYPIDSSKPGKDSYIYINAGSSTITTNLRTSEYNAPTIKSINPASDSTYQYAW